MKCVILAGGFGSRISEESIHIPKPMIEIGGKPIIWHIMKWYSYFGFEEFIICGGYKCYVINEYFTNYNRHCQDLMINLAENSIEFLTESSENWKITIIDTGLETMTGGRLKKIKPLLNETFCMTYGDGLSDVNISDLVRFHINENRKATMTIVQPAGRFGSVEFEANRVTKFVEKPKGDGGWVNGGFFVLEPEALEEIKDDNTVWEQAPLNSLANSGQLSSFRHNGFWEAMDTLRDKNKLEELWRNGQAPWRKHS